MKPPIYSVSLFLPPAEEKKSVEKKKKSEYSNLKTRKTLSFLGYKLTFESESTRIKTQELGI